MSNRLLIVWCALVIFGAQCKHTLSLISKVVRYYYTDFFGLVTIRLILNRFPSYPKWFHIDFKEKATIIH